VFFVGTWHFSKPNQNSCLQFLESPSVSVADQLCFLLLSQLMQVTLFRERKVVSFSFLIIQSENINIFILHISLQTNVADQVTAYHDLCYNFLVMFVSPCSDLWFL